MMMECLRIGFYQPFTLALVKRHALVIFLCLILALPWLMLMPEGRPRGAGAVLAFFLVLLSVMDFCYGYLYDRLLIPLGVTGFGLEVFGVLPHGPEEALAAAAGAGTFFALLRFVSRNGMGWGDVKYALVLGVWLGMRGTIVAAALSIILGGCLALVLLIQGWGRESSLPFGPFLSLGGYVSYIWGGSLWQWYWGLMI